ncbi:zinc finger protein 391-like [Hydractinia symbiolongicarpus]|uniref:zinc finger protein 391-like n=1 Tax=Hydractinia symbiolongicarpus TaxID=13093 RepID=UPI00254D6DE9|nr:zinc finger protein 391-like [Hydractinia symbiolongicarpus]
MAENSIEDIFLAEKVVDSGFGQQDGKRYYKIKWVRYTWEAEDSLDHMKELLDLFWSEHSGVQNGKDKSTTGESVEQEKNKNKSEGNASEVNSAKADEVEETNPESGLAVSVLLKEDDNSQMQAMPVSTDVDSLTHSITQSISSTVDDSNLASKVVKYITLQKHTCDVCLRSYGSAQSLKTHIKSHHQEKSFQCETCLKSFSERSTLKRHMYIHLEEKPFKCDHCERAFSDKSTLRRHIITHTGAKRFQCPSCNKRFTRNEHLRQHMYIHTAEKLYKCEVCNKDFRQRSTLKNHMLLHRAENGYKCDSCGALFSRQQQYDKHVLWCNGSLEGGFKCDLCDKPFQDRNSLKRHILIHSGERPFKCDHCDQSFNDRSILRRHVFTHIEKKPFQCQLCRKEFIRKASLVSHLSSQHAGEAGQPVYELVQSLGYNLNEGISLDNETLNQQVRFVIQEPNATENPISQVEVSSVENDGVSMLAHAVCDIPPTVLTSMENKPDVEENNIDQNQEIQMQMDEDLQPGDNQLLQVQIIQMDDGNQFVQSIQAIVQEHDEETFEHSDLVVTENIVVEQASIERRQTPQEENTDQSLPDDHPLSDAEADQEVSAAISDTLVSTSDDYSEKNMDIESV